VKFVFILGKERHVTVTSRADMILRNSRQMYPDMYESKENKRMDVRRSKRTVSRRLFYDVTNPITSTPKVAKHLVSLSNVIAL